MAGEIKKMIDCLMIFGVENGSAYNWVKMSLFCFCWSFSTNKIWEQCSYILNTLWKVS